MLSKKALGNKTGIRLTASIVKIDTAARFIMQYMAAGTRKTAVHNRLGIILYSAAILAIFFNRICSGVDNTELSIHRVIEGACKILNKIFSVLTCRVQARIKNRNTKAGHFGT